MGAQPCLSESRECQDCIRNGGGKACKDQCCSIYASAEAAEYFEDVMDVNATGTDHLEADAADHSCAKLGDCGRAYQACCDGFAKKGFPCGCQLQDGTGIAGSPCGDCGIAYVACCVGFKAKGFPCTCDVEPPSL